MADERSDVDVDERRDPEPDDGTVRAATTAAALAAGVGRLSPVQQAYSAYARHSLQCPDCRDVDRSCCVAEELWRTYQAVGAAACQQVVDGAL
ncbi:hypothetical protein [Streptomyces canus]|uniref:hypothetical protein n=1 Tax=Streptomyces canus TaxID=58343 RepID=UPI002788E0F2|nr:hypothetical protein [Streptomyces canus]MDQ0758655.1 hypothetical protein [Streptomyces canus]